MYIVVIVVECRFADTIIDLIRTRILNMPPSRAGYPGKPKPIGMSRVERNNPLGRACPGVDP